jgi:amino acid transporter
MDAVVFILVAAITIFIVAFRINNNGSVYKYISRGVGSLYDKYAPYSFKEIRQKVKDLGQEYTKKQYMIQISVFSISAAVVSYLYFYNILISLIYAIIAVAAIPYLTYLRCKRIYSEFIFEQIQVYTTNTIMEFATTQSFVKALEGVYESGVLEDPVLSDVKMMIDLAYDNGTIDASIEYMNGKYDFFIVRNMHQLFLQITNEGSKNSGDALENMSLDIDMLVENVYRDRMDRASFHKKFLQFGIILYLLVMLVQFLLTVETYIKLLNSNILVQILLHGIIIINSYFLLSGEKYYNENVGAE